MRLALHYALSLISPLHLPCFTGLDHVPVGLAAGLASRTDWRITHANARKP